MKQNLLYVDDQRENLIVFRAEFRKTFNVLEANNAEEALQLLQKHEIPVMVADQRMPDVTGVQLCKIVARDFPHTIRMILTGYIDTEEMMDAINTGHVYHFCTKPWRRETLLPILMRGLDAYNLAMANNALFERLDHAERCATLGRLTASMAHEMRNQLLTLPLVELVEERYREDQELMQLAEIARQTHDSLCGLINEVMDFVRKDNKPGRVSALNLAEVAREAVSLASLDDEVPKYALKLDVRQEPTVCCNKAKIEQVLFNLIRNAAHAVRQAPSPLITVTVDRDETQAVLSVQDNGTGIATENLQRIWEPFFSTKGDEGTGLGLDLCRRIVESHGGSIGCENTTCGACFRICFPEAASSQEAPAEARYTNHRQDSEERLV